MPKNVFISPLFLEAIFSNYRIPKYQFGILFSVQFFKDAALSSHLHCFRCKIRCPSYLFFSGHRMSLPTLPLLLRLSSWSLVFKKCDHSLLSVIFFMSLVFGAHWDSSICECVVFHQFGSISAHVSICLPTSFPSDSRCTYIRTLKLSHRSLVLCWFYSVFVLFHFGYFLFLHLPIH